MSNLKVGLYTLGLVLVWAVVLATASVDKPFEKVLSIQDISDKSKLWKAISASSRNAVEKRHEGNCKGLCEQCGCLGFYCGEECICECNNENADTECISRMQTNAKKLDIPFALLIQGPTSSRFVRNALQFEQNLEMKNQNQMMIPRNKRSTVTIYKPRENINTAIRPKRSPSDSDGQSELDWFNDWTSALVRPAPLQNKRNKKVSEDEESFVHKRSPQIDFDRSWFTDSNTNTLLRPAPLSKRQSSRKNSYDSLSEIAANPMSMVEKIPKVIKNTLRSFQEPEEDNENDFWNPSSGGVADLFGGNEPNGNRKALKEMERWRNNIVGAFEKLIEQGTQEMPTRKTTTTTTTTPSTSLKSSQLLMPWFKPMRLFQDAFQ